MDTEKYHHEITQPPLLEKRTSFIFDPEWLFHISLPESVMQFIRNCIEKQRKGKNLMIPKNFNEVSTTDLPTVLIKLHKTGPFPERDRNTFIIDLQQTSCIFSVYCGKLLICSTTRCSRTGVYTSGT